MRSLGRPAAKFAYVMVHDMDMAQEIVQEAFARVWAAPNTPSQEPEFRRYLYRTITNLAQDYHRQRARRAALPPPAPTVLDPLDQVEKREGDEAMKAALQVLGVRERQAVYLRYFEDLSFFETARIMGAPQVTVRVMVHRALGKLRRQLESERLSDKVAI